MIFGNQIYIIILSNCQFKSVSWVQSKQSSPLMILKCPLLKIQLFISQPKENLFGIKMVSSFKNELKLQINFFTRNFKTIPLG